MIQTWRGVILPIGESEWPGAPSRLSTLELWGNGRLHPAPLSRAKIEALGDDAVDAEPQMTLNRLKISRQTSIYRFGVHLRLSGIHRHGARSSFRGPEDGPARVPLDPRMPPLQRGRL